MTHPIPPDAQRLADRLRMLADEIESAARYGIPIPYCVGASGHQYGSASFSATPEEFAAWANYTEAKIAEYDHDDSHWLSAEVDVNGLPLQFAVRRGVEAVSA